MGRPGERGVKIGGVGVISGGMEKMVTVHEYQLTARQLREAALIMPRVECRY